MNIIVKSAVAAALALGATGAYALGIPANNSSDLVLVIQNNITPANVYVLDTGISIDSLMPTSGLAAPNSGTTLSTAIAGINASIAASPTLQAFLAANPAANDGWTIESGQYAGGTPTTNATNGNTKVTGSGKVVFASPSNQANIPNLTLANLQSVANGVQSELTAPTDALGLSPLLTATEASTGASYSVGAQTKYGLFGVSDLAALGSTAVTLYGLTGDVATGQPAAGIQTYILGSATLATNGQLTFAANTVSAVPLPAAVWLFGSGLMGLVGVSRRRKAAAAVAV
jgi:hypothetical protein